MNVGVKDRYVLYCVSKNHNHHTFCIIKSFAQLKRFKECSWAFGQVHTYRRHQTPLHIYHCRAYTHTHTHTTRIHEQKYGNPTRNVLRIQNEGNNLAAINPKMRARASASEKIFHICFLKKWKKWMNKQKKNERNQENITRKNEQNDGIRKKNVHIFNETKWNT